MGKGSRVRASRQAGRELDQTPSQGAVFGVGTDPRVLTAFDTLRPRVDKATNGVRSAEPARRAADRVRTALSGLEELATARADARRVVNELDGEIRVAVEHLRVDGASWVEVGRALGISRQGARQRYGVADAHRT